MGDDLTTYTTNEALKPLGDLLQKLCGPLAEEIGEGIGVWARHYRFKLAVRMFQKTECMLKDSGILPKAISPRLFLPIIESASLEEDEDLQTRWAALLANASAGNSIHPSFIEILSQLSPEDARYLDKLYELINRDKSRRTRNIPFDELISTWRANFDQRKPFLNISRLGLIEIEYGLDNTTETIDGMSVVAASSFGNRYLLTEIAIEFVEACRAPKRAD